MFKESTMFRRKRLKDINECKEIGIIVSETNKEDCYDKSEEFKYQRTGQSQERD